VSQAPAIRVSDVWKAMPAWDQAPTTRMHKLYRRVPALMRLGPQRWTLQSISFEVPTGGALGLIGGNGAGKSTLLKMLAGLIQPTQGSISVHGTVRSVLALGEAFDQQLSGSDNAITTAMIGGMSASDAEAALPRILDFADLERFADAPVRTYSEGMKLRLAMGVIAQLDGDVYLVDEVLAVGDAWFQARCLEFFRERRLGGATMVIASHDLDRLAGQVERLLWLDGGEPRQLDVPKPVLDNYRKRLTIDSLHITPDELLEGDLPDGTPRRIGSGEVRIESLAVTLPQGRPEPGAPLNVDLTLRAHDGVPHRCHVAVSLFAPDGTKAFDMTSASAGFVPLATPEGVDVAVRVPSLPLSSGEYRVEIGIYREDWEHGYDIRPAAGVLELEGRLGDEGVAWAPSDWTVVDRP
jgi:ABC-type polysaccharide/polyol phosphate transport system ATPase subunit